MTPPYTVVDQVGDLVNASLHQRLWHHGHLASSRSPCGTSNTLSVVQNGSRICNNNVAADASDFLYINLAGSSVPPSAAPPRGAAGVSFALPLPPARCGRIERGTGPASMHMYPLGPCLASLKGNGSVAFPEKDWANQ